MRTPALGLKDSLLYAQLKDLISPTGLLRIGPAGAASTGPRAFQAPQRVQDADSGVGGGRWAWPATLPHVPGHQLP